MSPFGYCSTAGGGGLPGCVCDYGCATDTDCAAGEICLCGQTIGACVTATCTVDSDCGSGSLCLSYSIEGPCSYSRAFACSTPADQCLDDIDCGPGDGIMPAYCTWDGSKRVCAHVEGVCGRPLVVDARPRIASLVAGRGGWSALASV
jgi:hypothetical protein